MIPLFPALPCRQCSGDAREHRSLGHIAGMPPRVLYECCTCHSTQALAEITEPDPAPRAPVVCLSCARLTAELDLLRVELARLQLQPPLPEDTWTPPKP